MRRLPADALAIPPDPERIREYCRALEAGEVLHMGPTPIPFTGDELAFLRGQRQSGAGNHKNIAYRPLANRLSGYAGADAERMRALMQRFSRDALAFLRAWLTPYQIEADFASFRPLEEEGRPAKLNARNDLLHVDAFPTRLSRGRRILRFFINLNSTQPRVWRTGPAFPALAHEFGEASGLLARYRQDEAQPAWRRQMGELLGALGMRHQFRPPYDRFMLSFHDWLKANHEFQSRNHEVSEYEPMSSWMVMTDTASHAVVRGRFALEQTVWILPHSLQAPEIAPENVIAVLAAGAPRN